MKARPNYSGPTLLGIGVTANISSATGAGIFMLHKAGSTSNYLHTEINPLH